MRPPAPGFPGAGGPDRSRRPAAYERISFLGSYQVFQAAAAGPILG
jgi:hypothetical protein